PNKITTFDGSVEEGGPVNHKKILISPHGNGTHTECFGHISPDPEASIYACLKGHLFFAQLISLPVREQQGDRLLLLEDLQNKMAKPSPEALIIRSLPNLLEKKHFQYSGSNPPYLEAELCAFLAEQNIEHLLVDIPSVDREEDEGKLNAHKSFWGYPERTRKEATITELIFVDPEIPDGLYLLNLQVISLNLDVSPSKPVIYPIYKSQN
ncbi:MAG: cyclase family protein, partial [Bacteroidota bacterium]